MSNIDLNVHSLHNVFGNRKKYIRQNKTTLSQAYGYNNVYILFTT